MLLIGIFNLPQKLFQIKRNFDDKFANLQSDFGCSYHIPQQLFLNDYLSCSKIVYSSKFLLFKISIVNFLKEP